MKLIPLKWMREKNATAGYNSEVHLCGGSYQKINNKTDFFIKFVEPRDKEMTILGKYV